MTERSLDNAIDNPGRRQWLGAGLAAASWGLAGCASTAVPMKGQAPIGRVVVLGGGYGGATTARYLKLWGEPIEVTLIERQAQFVSCPVSNLVLGGYRQMADITRGYDGLRAQGVRVLHDSVVAVDVERRRVRLLSGAEIPFDRLVLAPGIDFVPGAVAGLETDAARARVLHAWKAGPQTLALRQQLEAMPDGGVYALTIPPAPYRCPPAPYERACMVASYLQRHKPRSKVLVLDANPEIQSKKAFFERAFHTHYAGLVDYRPNNELREVDATRGVARFDFEDVRADVLNVVPPQRAADLARAAGLVNINQRWVGVNWLTLESTAMPLVHVLGDAVFPGPAMPKSGHMANQQAKVAAAAIVQLLRGGEVNARPVLTNTCYSYVTPTEVVHVASVHQYVPGHQTFEAVHAAGGLSEAANTAEADFAAAWAQNIWADTLG
jgi:sulfide dehydrogenase [flavocytochrome c] flavoprotein chain